MIALDKPNLLFVIGVPVGLLLLVLALSFGVYVAVGGRRPG